MDLFGLIGKPVSHSKSAEYFTKKFAAEECLDTKAYHLFELDTIDDLKGLLASQPDLRGLNVTYPYKKEIIPFLSSLSPEAERIGAVNCVRVEDDGRLVGYNTDYMGFGTSLGEFLGTNKPKVLVLGTGGASQAVQAWLEDAGFEFRTVSHSGKGDFSYEDLTAEVMEEYKLIINTTPLGMAPLQEECPPIPYELVTEEHYLMDLIYNPAVTEFLRRGQKRGAAVCNGQRMFVCQAEASWRVYGRL
ncbi:MAG: shikimate dehydrogenase [Tidjanibacter sp.]|nr:shikimate dehydrogenase [Tidjanibacter sp.]